MVFDAAQKTFKRELKRFEDLRNVFKESSDEDKLAFAGETQPLAQLGTLVHRTSAPGRSDLCYMFDSLRRYVLEELVIISGERKDQIVEQLKPITEWDIMAATANLGKLEKNDKLKTLFGMHNELLARYATLVDRIKQTKSIVRKTAMRISFLEPCVVILQTLYDYLTEVNSGRSV